MELLHNATTPLLRGQACTVIRHLCYVLYLRIPIVMCPSHSLLPVYASKYLNVAYLNKMIYINIYMKTKVISSDAKAYLSYVL